MADKFEKQVRYLIRGSLSGINVYEQRQLPTPWKGIYVRMDIEVDPVLPVYPDGFYVSCKWQNSGGSTQEKIVAEVEKIRAASDKPTIIVIDGRESSWMLGYAKQHANSRSMLRAAMNMSEFTIHLAEISNGGACVVDDDWGQKRLGFMV